MPDDAQTDDHQPDEQQTAYQESAYQKKGYLVFRQLLSSQQISQLKQLVQPVYQQWLAENQHQPGFAQLVNIHSLTLPHYFQQQPAQRLALFNALAAPVLVNTLAALFGDDLYFHNTQLFFNPRDANKQNYWHRDLQYSAVPDAQQAEIHPALCSLHVRIPLLDETGIELIPHTHQHWDSPREREVRFALNGCQQHEDLAHGRLISLKAGDVLLFNAQMIHRGRYDFNDQRLALDICMGRPHPLLQGFADPQVQPTQAELAAIGQAQWYQTARELLTANRASGTADY